MTDPPLSLSALAARQQHQPPLPAPLAPAAQVQFPAAPKAVDHPEVDGAAEEEDDGEISCICAYNWDDGFTIQCETCNKWNHMECYYPNEADRPGPDQTHYCNDCRPRFVDGRKATALQRVKSIEQLREGPKRPVPKGGRKKTKDSPQTTAAINGWAADKHAHLHGRDRKSASPRDQPPPAKRPKTTHRPSNSVNPAGGRKRNGSTLNHQRSLSKSPGSDAVYGPVLPTVTQEFLQIEELVRHQVHTTSNLFQSIEVTSKMAEWLLDPDAVERATNGQHKQIDVFKRWDGPFEQMPGKPETVVHVREDGTFAKDGRTVRYPCLTVEQEISQHTFIGELIGHVGFKEEYQQEPGSRWPSLRHCEPFVFFHPKLPLYIDARHEGSELRHVRRSCKPNAEMQTIITEGATYHFCFMAIQDIMPGEEITIGWEFDIRITAMYDERKMQMGGAGFSPEVRHNIGLWVSNVLANCGPCACSNPGCPMAFFDKRGKAMALEPKPAPEPEMEQEPERAAAVPAPVKPTKPRKRKNAHSLLHDENNRNSNSRSGSEIRKLEPDEDMTDSRSVSDSYRGSASRDITPSTHYSAILPEMSERERKKLMREEEMFRRQEEERGRQKKKRNSGSNLNTPSANVSVCCSMPVSLHLHADFWGQKQLGHPTTSRYADASTSSRAHATTSNTTTTNNNNNNNTSSSSNRRPGKQPRSLKSSTKERRTPAPPKPVYVDSAIQCDMDADSLPSLPLVTPPKRKQYLSVTQRLLRRCASNNFNNINKRKAECFEHQHEESKPVPVPQGDVMDIDKDGSPDADANTADVLPLSPISNKEREAEMLDAVRVEDTTRVPSSPAADHQDVDHPDVDMKGTEEEVTHPNDPLEDQDAVIKDDASPRAESTSLPSHPPMDPPPPPWPKTSPKMSPRRDEHVPTSSSPIAPEKTNYHRTTPPRLQISMSPTVDDSSTSNVFNGAPQTAGAIVQSPPVLSAGGLAPNSVFPPSVAAAVNPSPARKKMSLSDYTKRSKARETEAHRESSPATSVVSTDLATVREHRDKESLLHENAIIDSPAPESIPPSSAEKRGEVDPTTRLDSVAEKPTAEVVVPSALVEAPPVEAISSSSAAAAGSAAALG